MMVETIIPIDDDELCDMMDEELNSMASIIDDGKTQKSRRSHKSHKSKKTSRGGSKSAHGGGGGGGGGAPHH